MDNKYKIIISNKRIYKEVELSNESRVIKVGSTKNCVIRLSKELFFEDIEITLEQNARSWVISCEQNTYISSDGIMKLLSKELIHGDSLVFKYQDSNQEVFKIKFMIDFDFEKKDYDRVIEIGTKDEISIGGDSNNNIFLKDSLVANDTIIISKVDGKYFVFDNKTRYGVYLNGNKISSKEEIKDYDFISVIGYSFYYKFGKLYTSKYSELSINGLEYMDIPTSNGNVLYPKFNRNTRMKTVISKEKISILNPPPIPQKPKNNILASLVPAFAMLGLTVVLRGIMGGGGTFVIFSVCTMSIGIITSIVSFVNNKKQYKLDLRNRLEKYSKYVVKKRAEIELLREEEKSKLKDIYYSPEDEYEIVKSFSGNLFERKFTDIDFLHINIGSGTLLANRVVDYKKLEKLEVDDELAELPEQIEQEYRMINNAPIVCKLGENSGTGVIGEQNQLYHLMKNMILDICIRQYQSDVKIFIIINEENSHLINWTRMLPHVQNTYLNVRNIVCNDDSKNYLFEYLYKELSHRENNKGTFQRIIVFVFDELGLKKHPISKYIEKANELGFSFVFFETNKELLPIGCNQVITLDKDETRGILVDSADSSCASRFCYEIIEDLQALEIATKLAPVYCEEVSLEGSLTKNISIYELLNILSVEDLDIKQRWSNSVVHKSMAAPIGVKLKNEIVYLDIHEKAHGPHGLVAGTTGSGKSEILQSYILSMATLYHPYEVSFMIIDFKGGGMVNQFKDLPHLVGAITNIDGREIERSLKSMKAELQKRQRYFAQAGVNHIDAYIKMFKNGQVMEAIPHLVVITDEFAELKAEQPEFMKELISAARIGRSLGVHLILATQKPAGQVNEQIWSNSKFKLCLKVQTKEDSNEVLKSPLAAEIKEPGRTYFQVGNNEIFELFQSAYSGSPAKVDATVSAKEFDLFEVALSGKRKMKFQQKANKTDEKVDTQLNTIVEYIKNYCEKSNIVRPQSICLPPLPDTIVFENSKPELNLEDTTVEIGIYDNPDKQLQGKESLNLCAHNVMIIGSAQYGKTNLLQTIIRGLTSKYSPEELNIYIIDFGSMVLKNFEGLNHCGGVVCSFEDEKLKNLFKLLSSEIKERKEKLVSIGVSSFSSYREAGYRDIPQIVLIIDNLTALKEMYLQDSDIVVNICREGLTVGISVIIANAQTSGIGYKYLSNFSSRIALYCNDSSEYNNLFDYCKLKPRNIAGRCILEITRTLYECQTYLSFEGEKEIDRVNEMKRSIANENEKYPEVRAKKIPVIPQILTDVYVNQQFTYLKKPYHIVIGLDYSNVSPCSLDLRTLGVLTISGREGFGKSNFIRNIIFVLDKYKGNSPANVVVIDDVSKKLVGLKKADIVWEYTLLPEKVLEVLRDWEKELESRYEALVNGDEEYLNKAPLLLLLVQNQDVLGIISNDKEALTRYKLITTKYRAMKVCIMFTSIPNANIPFSSPELLKMIKETKHFLAFEDLSNFKLIDIPLASTREFKKPVEIGDAYYIKENEIKKFKTVLHTVKK